MVVVEAAAYYIHKYFNCCWRIREDWTESSGCAKVIKIAFQHVIPVLLFLTNMATDVYYLLTIPSCDSSVMKAQIVTLFLPQLWFFRYSLMHALDGNKSFCSFFCHFLKRYFAYMTGQIDLLLKMESGQTERKKIEESDPNIEKYRHNSVYLIVQDIP